MLADIANFKTNDYYLGNLRSR